MAKKILIIEDEAELVKTLMTLFGGFGFTVSGALDGTSGVLKAKIEKPDLIILDLKMPIMDGFATVKALKADSDTRNIPIIIVTGMPKEDLESKFSKLKGIDYVNKPIDSAVLIKNVQKTLMLKNIPTS